MFSVTVFFLTLSFAATTICNPIESEAQDGKLKGSTFNDIEAASWPKVPPAFTHNIEGLPSLYFLTFSRIDVYIRKPAPQPSTLRDYIVQFRQNIADHTAGSPVYTTETAKQSWVDTNTWTKYNIEISKRGWFTRHLSREVVLAALDSLTGLVHNRAPAVLEMVLADEGNRKGYYKITTGLMKWGPGVKSPVDTKQGLITIDEALEVA